MLIDFAAEKRVDIKGTPVQLYAAYGEGPDRREVAMHFAGEQISVDVLEQNFNAVITALRKAENGNLDD